MTIPLIVLAALSVLGGAMLLGDWIVEWLTPVVGEVEHHELAVAPIVLTLIITAVVAVGVALAWFLVGKPEVPRVAPAKVSVFTRAARADLYGDSVNEALFMRPGDRFVGDLTRFDDGGVDGAVNGTAATFAGLSGRFRRWQTGYVRSYALSLLAGAVLVLGMLLAVSFS
jgi:NADH-quinone oxidoreductase subunit L